jgi:two-component system chemotaxis response regulator CheB
MTIVHGRIYLAPPNYHMLLDGGRIRLFNGPKEHFTRPAIDPLFRSAAIAYGVQVVGVILSGALYDGASGLMEIKRHGGAWPLCKIEMKPSTLQCSIASRVFSFTLIHDTSS